MARPLGPVLSLALLASLLASCAVEPGTTLARQPIIAGEIDTAHPEVVALTVFGSSEFCSGTVIAPRAVLTAAHCIYGGYDPAAILVFFGTTVGGEGTLMRITAATYHPDFYSDAEGYVYHDVAVLTLEQDAPVKPAAWQRTPLEDISGATVTFVGYGVTDARTQTGNDTRRTVDGVVDSINDDPGYVHFAGNGVSGTCQGDSGGPTFLDRNGVPTVIAVTSIGIWGCVSESDNTRVDLHADFIAPLAPVPVELEVSAPTEGAYVGKDFQVVAAARSPAGVAEVALLLDGQPLVSTAAPPYTFDLASIPDGDHILSLQATGLDGGHGAVDVWVTVATQAVGVACSDHSQCRSGVCAEAGSPAGGFCTKACTTDADCPSDSSCNVIAGGKLCGRPGSLAGGCAAAGRTDGAALGLLGFLAVALAGLGTLRRRGARRWALLALVAASAVALTACGDNLNVYQVDAAYPVQNRPLNDAAVPLPDGAVLTGIGDACTSETSLGQGDCPVGLICLTAEETGGLAANGYCTLPCAEGLACPDGSTCVLATQHSSLCLKTCAAAAECRESDGYHCMDKGGATTVCWNWITPPGTNDGGACSSTDGGPYVNAANRLFGDSQQLLAPDGGIVEAQPLVVAKGSTIASAFVSSASAFGGTRIGVTASQDQGVSFGPAAVVKDSVTSRKSDPILTIDPTGAHLYLGWVGYDRSSGGSTNMRVFVARSDDAGLTWPTANIVDATTSDSGANTVARPWLAAGPSGSVYVAYVFGQGSAATIKVARSLDLGATWDAPVRVDDSARTPSARGLPHVATNAAGDVFVAWGEVGLGVPNGDANNDVFVARWDAGDAWGAFNPNVKANADGDLVVSNGLMVVPSLAGTNLHVVYVAGPPESQRWDVRLSWSADRGDTFFGSSIKINDDASCAIHVLPTAAVDSSDRLHVAWYDNRFGTEEGAYYYASWTAAGGPSPSQLISDGTFAYSTEVRAQNRLGNYAGLAVDGTHIYATWADSRGVDNVSHVRFASGTLP